MLGITDVFLLLAFGALGSFMSGFLGIGGGAIFIPVIDYYLVKSGFEGTELVKAILANSLFVIIFSGTIASFHQYKIGNFNTKKVFQTAIPGMISAVVATWFIKKGNWYNKEAFNFVFAGMLLIIALRMFFVKDKPFEHPPLQHKSWHFITTGFLAGIITAFSGLGGGVVMTPVLTDLLKMNIKKAAGISNGVIPFFAISVGIINLTAAAVTKISIYQIGNIIFPVVAPIAIASLLFAKIGVKTAQKVSKQTIRITFAILTSIILFKTLYEIFNN